MQCFSFLILWGFLGVNSIQARSNISLDFSAAEKFYEFATRTSEINVSEIDDLMNSEAYQNLFRYLTHNWGKAYNQELYTQLFKATFMPEQYQLDEKYAYGKWLVSYMNKLRKNPEPIKNYLQVIKDNFDEKKVLSCAFSYLPEETKNDDIKIYFVVGVRQGCASEYGVFIDNYSELKPENVDKYIHPWLAHESHHFFRAQFNKMPKAEMQKHPKLFQSFYWLETEGLAERAGSIRADLFAYMQSENCKNDVYKNFAAYLKEFNSALESYLLDKAPDSVLIESLQPQQERNRYHEMGHVMAYTIEKVFGKKVLLAQIGKPLQFVLYYHKAAKKLDQTDLIPPLSEEVVKKLKDLE